METYLQSLLCITSSICLWSSVLLFCNWQRQKPRRWLAAMLLFWGLAWGARACALVFGHSAASYSVVLPPSLILAGMFASFTFLIWPVALLNSPNFNARRLSLFLLPSIVCAVAYYGIIGICGLKTFTFSSAGEFRANIAYFSVWFRLVMCLCLLGYLVVTIKLIYRYVNRYNQFVEDNFAEYDKFTVNWMPAYVLGLVAISILFFVNLFVASLASFIAHNIVSALFLAWLSAKVMVYNSPYSPDFSNYAIPELPTAKGEDFQSMFVVYQQQIEKWLLEERPYLNADFSLKDVMARFNLNRTYASRIFNEGFGKSFLSVIREYRIDYAKLLIMRNPSTPLTEVAFLCGYSTPQAFHKAFVFCNDGLTPGKFVASKSDVDTEMKK